MPTTEAAIDNGILRDIYLVIGDPQDGGGWAVRTYIKPFANWIWAGAIIMALGRCSEPDRPALPGGRRRAQRPGERGACGMKRLLLILCLLASSGLGGAARRSAGRSCLGGAGA